jgi:hypothetical protein
LDDRDRTTFLSELEAILDQCNPKSKTRFCFAIEESEAWLLGDLNAVRKAYPDAHDVVLDQYVNDSVCGTWEILADAIFPGGRSALARKGWQSGWRGEVPLGGENFSSHGCRRERIAQLPIVPGSRSGHCGDGFAGAGKRRTTEQLLEHRK